MDVHTGVHPSPRTTPTLREVLLLARNSSHNCQSTRRLPPCGASSTIRAFHKAIANIFVVGTFVIDRDLVFNRLHIHRETSGSLIFNMQEYVDKILPIPISKERRRKSQEKCTPQELTAYRALAGSLNFLGHGVLLQASFAASNMQQSVGRLHVSNLITANQVLTELRSLSPILIFRSPTSLESAVYLAFSDASQGSGSYGLTRYVSGLFLPTGGEPGISLFKTQVQMRCFLDTAFVTARCWDCYASRYTRVKRPARSGKL